MDLPYLSALKTYHTHFFHNLLHGIKNLPGGFLSRKGSAALIGTHAAFVYPGIGGKFTYVKEVEIVEKGRNVIAELHRYGLYYRDIIKTIFPGILYCLCNTVKEVLFGFLYASPYPPK